MLRCGPSQADGKDKRNAGPDHTAQSAQNHGQRPQPRQGTKGLGSAALNYAALPRCGPSQGDGKDTRNGNNKNEPASGRGSGAQAFC